MNSWSGILEYVYENLQAILLVIIGLKIGSKILKALSIICIIVMIAVTVLALIEMGTGYEIPFPIIQF